MLSKINGFINKISLTEKLLYLFIILIPIMRVPYLPFVGQKIQYSDLVFLFLFFIWLSRFLKRKKDFLNVPLGFTLAGMLLIFIFSFIHSEYWLKSSIEFIGIVYLVCLYMLLHQLVDTQVIWWRLVKCWCILSLLIAVTGIIAYFLYVMYGYQSFLMVNHDNFANMNSHLCYRLSSIFRHPGMLTIYLHASIVFGFVLAADSIRKAVNLMHKKGIEVWGYFIFGLPGETKDTIRETISFAKSLPLDMANFAVAAPYPGTKFYNEFKHKITAKNWEEYDQNDSAIVEYEGLACENIMDAVRRANFEFYLRPRQICRILKEFADLRNLFPLADTLFKHMVFMHGSVKRSE